MFAYNYKKLFIAYKSSSSKTDYINFVNFLAKYVKENKSVEKQIIEEIKLIRQEIQNGN